MPETYPSHPTSQVETLYKVILNNKYSCPTPGSITRIAITPTASNVAPTQELCADLKSCGFNCATFVVNKSEKTNNIIRETITRCRNSSLAPLVRCPDIETNLSYCRNLINDFIENLGLAGWYLNTPTIDELDNPNGPFNCQAIMNAYHNVSTPHMVMMNVFATAKDAGGDYRDYMTKFQTIVKPSIWGTTVYPAVTHSGGVEFNEYDLFFRELEILSLISRYCELPFWFTV